MKEVLTNVAFFFSCATTIATGVVLIVKPVREKVLGTKKQLEGMKCLLRADMLRIYYSNKEHKQIKQYEYENFIHEYQAYKASGGNSFIDHIKEEVDEWEVGV